MLKNTYYNNIKVVGTLSDTVCYINAVEKINNIYKEFSKVCVIVVDAALSNKENIGKVLVSNKKMRLGTGMGKKSIEIGDISIKGIVAKNTNIVSHNFKMLQNVSLNLVVNLAEITSTGIYNSIIGNLY